MGISDSTVDVVIIGAGSAGLAAARTAAELGLSVTLLEAAHRIGGRAFTDTETLGFPFDLGCHWMHSASLNPYVAIADSVGHAYVKTVYPYRVHLGDRWASEAEGAGREAFDERCHQAVAAAAAAGRDVAISDVTPRDDRWKPMFDLWASILHSADSDQVSTVDSCNYNDTDENWPLADGYGSLLAAYFAGVPVALNSRAERIDWGGGEIAVTTPRGMVRAARAIVTVSTGVLGAEDIHFEPRLPDWKLAAIASLPLGSHNRVGIAFDRDVFGPGERGGFMVYKETSESIAFQIRPFDREHAVGLVGGRFGDWLERQGANAMAVYAIAALKGVYGNDIEKRIVKTTCSAWRGDPFVRGAYSSALPGRADARGEMAAAVDGKLFFAGEATSLEFFSTCHGAYLTGHAAANDVAESLGAAALENRSGVA